MLALLVFAAPVRAASPTFSDVPDDYVHAEGIALAAELGIVKGYPDGTFRPTAKVTERQVVTMLSRLFEKPWIVDGWGGRRASRAWTAFVALAGAADFWGFDMCADFNGCEDVPSSFDDVPRDHEYALYVELADEHGIMSGYPDRSFRPNRTLTRAQAASVVHRLNLALRPLR